MYSVSTEKAAETARYGVTAKPNLYARADRFSRILARTVQTGVIRGAGTISKGASQEKGTNVHSPLVRIGTLSDRNPSVSNLLIKHPVHGEDCWKIIHSPANRNKAFKEIGKGASVYLNPANHEITWKRKSTTDLRAPDNSHKADEKKPEKEHQVFLGKLSGKKPTVSHLLVRHPAYGKDCWRILSNDLNRSKEFRNIPTNTPVYLNSATGEITWGESMSVDQDRPPERPPSLKAKEVPTTEPNAFSQKLATVVKPYIGTSYHKINCFELLVHGLEEMGIQYRGPDGLGSRLIKRALSMGLPENHYLSGEGLIKTSGALVYSKSIPKISRSGKEARALYKEIEPLLREGQILSFSTPSRGHTGIVSRQKNRWTYINSGNMDNVVSGRKRKGVGEESLKPEIGNWFRLAAGSGETLSVTIGMLNERKLKGEAV